MNGLQRTARPTCSEDRWQFEFAEDSGPTTTQFGKLLPRNHVVGLSSRCGIPVDIVAISADLQIRSVRPCNHPLWDRIDPSTANILITINVDGVVVVSAINHHIIWGSPSVEESTSVDARRACAYAASWIVWILHTRWRDIDDLSCV